MNCTRDPRSTPSLVVAVIIIAVGLVLLLDRLGIVDAWVLFRFWPMLLIAAGLSHLLRPGGCGKVGGTLMVVVGALFQLSTLDLIRLDWSAAWPLLVIALGGALLWRAISAPRRIRPAGDTSLNEWVMFGGQKIRNATKDFRGGKLLAIFGGFEVDLTKADISQQEAVLDLTAIFAGIEVRTPQHWRILPRVTPVLGGLEDNTTYPKPERPEETKTLIVQGLAMFGGIEIKN